MTWTTPASIDPGGTLLLPTHAMFGGPVTRARILQTGVLYGGIFALGLALAYVPSDPSLRAFGLGLIVPGGGFVGWAVPGNALAFWYWVASLLSLALFVIALIVWFSTGNAVLPLAVWLVCAMVSSAVPLFADATASAGHWDAALWFVPLGALSVVELAFVYALLRDTAGLRKREQLNDYLRSVAVETSVASPQAPAPHIELSLRDLHLMRLILDRALQPLDRFDGFEWIDQFQTSAVRYQLNFMGLALSTAQYVHLPAFQGYLTDAQENLVAKQQDYRIWRYWQLENMWGNLRTEADPIPRDNIMFTGFVAAQIAGVHAATGQRTFDQAGSLAFQRPRGQRYDYDQSLLIAALMRGFRGSEFGLMACEPNWVYPLCNAIGASAVRAFDATAGTAHWESIQTVFRQRLETEFITAGGRFVSCRSSATGLAMLPIGGAVMQAFPCFFLNSIFPDMAQRQWRITRRELGPENLERALWPIDVGNYRVSRASSYTATAVAAVEMGDNVTAQRLLEGLDAACAWTVEGGVGHRANASLWAHAVELMARCGHAGSYRTLVTAPRSERAAAPFIKAIKYPDVLVALAKSCDVALRAVLYPGAHPGFHPVAVGGLRPGGTYEINGASAGQFTASATGETTLQVCLHGRTEIVIKPLA
jgi:Linalool dehydratase/isomerase